MDLSFLCRLEWSSKLKAVFNGLMPLLFFYFPQASSKVLGSYLIQSTQPLLSSGIH